MHLRKDVNVYVHYPDAKLFQVIVELQNVPGALESVLGVLRGLNLKLLGCSFSVDSTERTGVWSGFVEDSDHTAPELRQKISSSEHVLDSIVVESKNGLLVDTVHYPLALNTGERAMMIRTEHLGRMLTAMRRQFGTGGNVMLYQEGLFYGKDEVADYIKRLGFGFARSNLKDVLMVYQALGWFKLEGVDQNEQDRTVTIRTSGSFECEGAKSLGPYSHFMRGCLSGGLTTILGEEMLCKETKCIAAGDQYCEFVLMPKARMGAGSPEHIL